MLAHDDSFWNQQQEEERQEKLDNLKNLLWIRETILQWPNAKERTLEIAERFGLKEEFEQYIRGMYGD